MMAKAKVVMFESPDSNFHQELLQNRHMSVFIQPKHMLF